MAQTHSDCHIDSLADLGDRLSRGGVLGIPRLPHVGVGTQDSGAVYSDTCLHALHRVSHTGLYPDRRLRMGLSASLREPRCRPVRRYDLGLHWGLGRLYPCLLPG